MNFLPLALIFLMIFSAISFSFIHFQGLDKGEKDALLGSIKTMRQAYNRSEEIHHKKRIKVHEKQKPSTNSKKTKSTKKNEDTYFRIQWINSSQGAINLAYLIFCHGKDYELLLDATIRYLEKIYEKASFTQTLNNPNWARPFLLSILEEQKKSYQINKSFLPLSELHPQAEIKNYFNRLIRGTKTWNLLEQQGYPPLEYCICFKKQNKKPIVFSIINPILVEVLFKKEKAKIIYEFEIKKKNQLKKTQSNNKKSHLNKEELRKILGDHESNLLNLLSFKRPKSKNISNKSTDQKSKISEEVQSHETIKQLH